MELFRTNFQHVGVKKINKFTGHFKNVLIVIDHYSTKIKIMLYQT